MAHAMVSANKSIQVKYVQPTKMKLKQTGVDDVQEKQRKEEYRETVRKLLPRGTVSPLSESEECLLCNTEQKGERKYYAIMDMGHAEPAGKKTSAIGIRVNTNVGSIVPLQIACCERCRRNHLIGSYLKSCIIVAMMIAGLVILSIPVINQALSAIYGALPMLTYIALFFVSWLGANIVSRAFFKSRSRKTHFTVNKIPFVAEMMQHGWFLLYSNGKDQDRLFFSKTKLKNRGLD